MFSVHIIITCRYVLEYYTDWHDVDEELMTIASYGGHWDMTDWGGAVCRTVEFGHITRDVVASKK